MTHIPVMTAEFWAKMTDEQKKDYWDGCIRIKFVSRENMTKKYPPLRIDGKEIKTDLELEDAIRAFNK